MTTIEIEYRIELPFTLAEYYICQLYTTAQMSITESKGDVGIEIKENVDSTHPVLGACRKTHKVMHLNSRIPYPVRLIIPPNMLLVNEISFNAFPKCITTYTNPGFNDRTFVVTVESEHRAGRIEENVFKFDTKVYSGMKKDCIRLDEPAVNKKYDPRKCNVERRLDQESPRMVCYKYVKIVVDKMGLGWTATWIEAEMRKIFLGAHQRMYCTISEWKDKNIEDVRRLEEKAKEVLEEKKKNFV